MRRFFIVFAFLLVSIAPAAAQATPEDAVAAFLNNWQGRNYDAMYNQLSERSRSLTAFPVFETTYREAATAIGLENLTYTVQEAALQGVNAAVTYDLIIESGVFGAIEDTGRIMRLTQEAQGWRVAWSHMDIFDGLTAGAQLRPFGQREPRANIYDRNGLPLVEQNGIVTELYVSRQSIINEAVCLDILANVLRRQRQDLEAFFGRYNPDSLFYIGEVDDDVFALREAELNENCAVTSVERQTRNYYRGNAVSHVTGYIGQIPADELATWETQGYISGELIGLNGIERAYETQLSGRPSRTLQIVDSSRTVLRQLGQTTGIPPKPVTLTVDRELQVEVAQAMADAYNYAEGNWGSRDVSTGAAAIVMDVNTGAILAMASYPLFEPDIFNPDTPCCTFIAATDRIADMLTDVRAPLRNRVVQEQYAPGSVYKIVTTAAVAAEGIFGRNEIFECTHTWDGAPFGDDVGFQRVDWRLTDGLDPTGPVNISQALTSSCDPFFYQMGAELYNRVGQAALVEHARRMGLDEPTGINYYGPEAAGDIPVPGGVSAAINSAIGQGDVKVTPIQMARLVAGIANGGTVYKPYLVQQVGGADFTPVDFEAQPEVAVEMGLSQEVLDIVRAGMCEVTTNEDLGTGVSSFGSASYHACGKTGTAQTSRYPTAWFVAYAPAENPEIAVVVVAENSREGSDVAAPIVRRIMDIYFGEPRANYPDWWFENEYVPVDIPVGATGG